MAIATRIAAIASVRSNERVITDDARTSGGG
jgi:hypothetical protein